MKMPGGGKKSEKGEVIGAELLRQFLLMMFCISLEVKSSIHLLIGSCMSTKTNRDFVKGKTKR